MTNSEQISVLIRPGAPGDQFNIAIPGDIASRKFAATDMNNHTGELQVTEGADSIVKVAMIDPDGPAGIFVDRLGPAPWRPPETRKEPA